MRLTRTQFLIILGALFGVALALAYFYKHDYADVPADIAYLIGLAVVVGFCLRVEFWAGALASYYFGSVLFCFFFLIVAPIEAPLLLGLFLYPTYQWQKRRLGDKAFIGSAFGLTVASAVLLHRPAVPVLLFPLLHLIAKRIAARVQPRYSRFTADLGMCLSSTHRRGGGAPRATDWVGILQEEFETLPVRFKEVMDTVFGGGIAPAGGDEVGPKSEFLHVQDATFLSQALTDLARRDPAFKIDAFLKRAESVFWKIQKAWYGQHLEPIQPLVSDALYEQFVRQIEEQQAAGIRFQYTDMTIFENRPVQINTDPNFDVIHLYVRASSIDSIYDLQTKEVLAEEEHRRQFVEYWTFIRRPSAKTLAKPGLLEGQCPNCGAPLEVGQATVCQVCKSFIRSGEYDWVLAKITQACEWEYLEPERLPGWGELTAADPGFTMQQIEDRGGVMFWMFRQAERTQQVAPIARFATPECCARFEGQLKKPVHRDWNFMENIALGSVRFKGAQLGSFRDRVFLLVVWSGITAMRLPDGRVERGEQVPSLHRDVFVLVRQHGQATNQLTALTSAHCPSCGGPLSSAFSVACTYCSTVLNEGTAGWILERVCAEFDPAYRNLAQAVPAVTAAPKLASLAALDRGADLIYVVIQIMWADHEINDQELALLQEMAQQQGINQAQLERMIREIQSGRVHIPGVQSGKQALDVLEAAARMALIDGEVGPQEEAALFTLSKYLGYAEADVRRIISKIRSALYRDGTLTNPAAEAPQSSPPEQAAGAPIAPAGPVMVPSTKGISPAPVDVLAVMIQVLVSDGRIQEPEIKLLRGIATQAAVPDQHLHAMLVEGRGGTLALPRPATPQESWALLRAAAQMAWADGEVVPEEEAALEQVAAHLGYTKFDVKQALAKERPTA